MAEQKIEIEMKPVIIAPKLILKSKERRAPTLFRPIPAAVRTDKKRPLILNIETLGLNPWENRIITIGFQDPKDASSEPIIMMKEDEKQMIKDFMDFYAKGRYDQIVGYNLGFDFRYILIRAMFYGIPVKQFFDSDLYDLMQAMAQGKLAFVYNAQKAPNLSDMSDFFFSYPKPFSDLDMMAFYVKGDFDKVLEFAYGQIVRTLLLYNIYRIISETDHIPQTLGTQISGFSHLNSLDVLAGSLLTFPGEELPKMWTAKCPNDLSEHEVLMTQDEFVCPIDGHVIRRPGA